MDDNEMTEELQKLDDTELARIKGDALGKLSLTNPEGFDKLGEVDWFNISGLEFSITKDGKFLISSDLIGTIPEDTDKKDIKLASRFIRAYLEALSQSLNESQAVKSDVDWLETFLIGVVEHRR